MCRYLWKFMLKSAHLFSQTGIDTETYSLKMWSRLLSKMAAMTSSFDQIAPNWNAHPLAYVRLLLESFVEIGPVVPPNRSGHTHTHTHTHRHLPFFPGTITIHLVNEMTKCKNHTDVQTNRLTKRKRNNVLWYQYVHIYSTNFYTENFITTMS